MTREWSRWLVVTAALLAIVALGGCAGTVTRGQRPADDAPRITGVSQVSATLSAEAVKQQPDNAAFNREELVTRLRQRLLAKGLKARDAPGRIEILVTDIRVRGAFSAIMFGFMAGDDHVDGQVRLFDGSNRVVRSFAVHASYAFGGIAGGQDGVRMNWLYDKFAELAMAEVEGSVSAPAIAGEIDATPWAGSRPTAPAVALAAIDDVDAVPVGERGRNAYREWLGRRYPRAFVVADKGYFYALWGTVPPNPSEPTDPTERGLKRCREAGRLNCRVYAVDGRVMELRSAPKVDAGAVAASP